MPALLYWIAWTYPACAEERNFVLAKVRLVDISEDYIPYPCSAGTKCVSIGGFFKVKLKVISVYAGNVPADNVHALFPMDSEPITRELYVLADASPGKPISVIDWSQTYWGFCILNPQTAEKFGMSVAAAEVRRAHPCRPNRPLPKSHREAD